MIDLRARQRFARLVTDLVIARPGLWGLVRRPFVWMFGAIAPDWEETRVTPQHSAPLEVALDALPGGAANALDIGTGTGVGARLIAARFPGAYWNASMLITAPAAPPGRPVCSKVPCWNRARPARPASAERSRAAARPAGEGSTPVSKAPVSLAINRPGPPAPQVVPGRPRFEAAQPLGPALESNRARLPPENAGILA